MNYNHPILIALVNMHKRNAVTHALLNSDRFTNIFLIQEPWYDTISVTDVYSDMLDLWAK